MDNSSYHNRDVVRFIFGEFKGYIGIITRAQVNHDGASSYSGIVFGITQKDSYRTTAKTFSNIPNDHFFKTRSRSSEALSADLKDLQRSGNIGGIAFIDINWFGEMKYAGIITHINDEGLFSGYYYRPQYQLIGSRRMPRRSSNAVKVFSRSFTDIPPIRIHPMGLSLFDC